MEDPATYRINAGVDLALALGISEHTPLFVRDCLLQHTDTDRAPRTQNTQHKRT
ncbi:MAG: hypothetical protein ACRDRH_12355 [Pseudonocardia sp.]